jgi:hypothetical protein
VGARDTQVPEKLQETFFYRQFDFRCHSVHLPLVRVPPEPRRP